MMTAHREDDAAYAAEVSRQDESAELAYETQRSHRPIQCCDDPPEPLDPEETGHRHCICVSKPQPAVDVEGLAVAIAHKVFGHAERDSWRHNTLVELLRAHLAQQPPAPGVDAPSHAKMLDHITEPAEPFRLDADSGRFRGIIRWLGTLDTEQQAISKIALRALAARNVLRQAQEQPDAKRPS